MNSDYRISKIKINKDEQAYMDYVYPIGEEVEFNCTSISNGIKGIIIEHVKIQRTHSFSKAIMFDVALKIKREDGLTSLAQTSDFKTNLRWRDNTARRLLGMPELEDLK